MVMETATNLGTNQQSRIDKLLNGETMDAKKSAAGMFDQSELDRIAAVMEMLGMHNRSDLIHEATMDAIEKIEPVAKVKAEAAAQPDEFVLKRPVKADAEAKARAKADKSKK
jgi:hypothetical protein